MDNRGGRSIPLIGVDQMVSGFYRHIINQWIASPHPSLLPDGTMSKGRMYQKGEGFE